VRARSFGADGTPQSAELVVNDFVTGAQRRAGVSVGPDDSFVVVWDSAAQDGDGYGVFARRFLAGGTADGTEFQVNDYTTGFQGYTNSVASDGQGNFYVVWADGQRDGDAFGVYTRALCTDDDADGDCDLRCGREPASGCRSAEAGKSKLTIKDTIADDTRDSMKWKWGKGVQTPLSAFLDPLSGTADYRFCVYDSSAATQPLMEAALEPGGQCGDAPCWKATGSTGYAFRDDSAAQHGIFKVKLKAGDTGKAQVQVLAKGAATAPPAPPLTGDVVVQLLASDGGVTECWQTVYTDAKKNIANAKVGVYSASGP
jgi:hypothetical protein